MFGAKYGYKIGQKNVQAYLISDVSSVCVVMSNK